LAKYNPDGSCAWAVSGGGDVVDAGTAVAVDEQGNSVITGYYSGTAHFGPFSVDDYSYNDIFLAKYDSAGTCIWLRKCGGEDLDIGTGVGTDKFGNVYLAGSFDGGITFHRGPTISGTGYDVFVAKYNSDGDFLWVKQGGNGNSDLSKGLWVDKGGNAYLTGYYFYVISFDDINLSISSDADIFTTKISPGPENVAIPPAYSSDVRAAEVWPNPVSGDLHFSWDGQSDEVAEYLIFNSAGRLVSEGELAVTASGSTKINTQNWVPGLYHLEVTLKNKTAVTTFIVN